MVTKLTALVVFFLALATLSRVLTDRNAPGVIRSASNALSSLFTNTMR